MRECVRACVRACVDAHTQLPHAHMHVLCKTRTSLRNAHARTVTCAWWTWEHGKTGQVFHFLAHRLGLTSVGAASISTGVPVRAYIHACARMHAQMRAHVHTCLQRDERVCSSPHCRSHASPANTCAWRTKMHVASRPAASLHAAPNHVMSRHVSVRRGTIRQCMARQGTAWHAREAALHRHD